MDDNPYQAPQTRSYNVSEPEREDWSDRAPRGLLQVSGEDVGRFVRALVLHGLMEASNDDRPEDFNGVGPLRQFPG